MVDLCIPFLGPTDSGLPSASMVIPMFMPLGYATTPVDNSLITLSIAIPLGTTTYAIGAGVGEVVVELVPFV